MFFGAGTVSGRRVHKIRCLCATNSCTMRILSLNIWGVPNATHRHRRVRDFADMLQANADHYDVVCLQECFVAKDVAALTRAARLGRLGHSHVFRNGAGCWGSNSPGMVVFSRFPIRSARLCRFACSGKVHKLHQMDGMHHKAIGLAVLDGGDLGLLCVYVTHFVAVYSTGDTNDEYYAHRLMQAREAARFIRDTSRDASLVVVCGDLNAQPSHPVYEHLVAAAGLSDTGYDLGFATYARPGNPYVHDTPERIDYVLWRSGSAAWSVTCAGIDADTDRRTVSDHAGVFAEFEMDGAESVSHPGCATNASMTKHNLHMVSVLKNAIAECAERTNAHRTWTACCVVVVVVAACVYRCAPWLAPLAASLGVLHFVVYGVYCGEEMSSLVQAHNELAIELRCRQENADELGDGFEFACVMLAMGHCE